MTREPDPSPVPAFDPESAPLSRRGLLWLTSRVAMLAGLAGGYGMFAWLSGRFLLPAHAGRRQQLFVARASEIPADSTLVYHLPDGRPVNITRRGTSGGVGDFIALSSTCPHLGCQVHWEGQNNRYFCPCHNGTFAPDGTATGGPPADARQTLPRYALSIDRELLYLFVPVDDLSTSRVAHGPTGPAARRA